MRNYRGLLVCVLVTGCAAPHSISGDNYTIVLSLPLTGRRDLGKDLLFAANDALAHPGLESRTHVTLHVLDNGSAADPDPGAYQVSDIADMKTCLFYLLAQGNLQKELPVLNRAGIPLINLTQRRLDEIRYRRNILFPAKKWTLASVAASDEQYVRSIHNWLLANDAQGYVLAYEPRTWGERVATHLSDQSDISPKSRVTLTPGREGTDSLVDAITAANAGTLCLFVDNSKVAIACVRRLAKQGLKIRVLLDPACLDDELVASVSELDWGGELFFLNSEIAMVKWSSDGQGFHDRFVRDRGEEPSPLAVAVWNGVRVALQCLGRDGRPDRSSMLTALFTNEFDGALGPFRFWPDGELRLARFGVWKIEKTGKRFVGTSE